MNDKEKQVEEVLHFIDSQLYLEVLSYLALAGEHITLGEYELYRDAHLEAIYNYPKLAILDDAQRLPEIPRFSYSHADYLRAQSDMLQANFRRIIPREVKE